MNATTIEVIEEWAGHNRTPAANADKIWAAAYTSAGHYLAVWGRRGTRYQAQTRALPGAAAAALFRAKRAEKLRRGYLAVPFADGRFGAIPSFATAGTGRPPVGPARITLDGVLAELAAVPGSLRRPDRAGEGQRGREHPSRLPELIFAFTQTRVKAELLLAGGRLDEAERQACLEALAAARRAVGLALAA